MGLLAFTESGVERGRTIRWMYWWRKAGDDWLYAGAELERTAADAACHTTVLTRIEVSPDDPAFYSQRSLSVRFISQKNKRALEAAYGWQMKRDSKYLPGGGVSATA